MSSYNSDFLLSYKQALTLSFNLKSYDMDSVQVGEAVFETTTLKEPPREV